MIIARIRGFTRELGKSQGYRGLPIRDETFPDGQGGETPYMTSAWEPTPQELAMLNAGGKLMLRVMGNQHPPVALWCEPPPAEGETS